MTTNPTILLVDDDDVVREFVAVALGQQFTILTAASGSEALSLAATAHPDAILLDVEMRPGPDGYETCRLLKAELPTNVPVIFVSAHDGLQDRLQGYEAGGDDYVLKPFDVDELEAKLRRLLALSAEHSGLRRMADDAMSTAMTAMTNMNELGVLIETMKKLSVCEDCRTLADAAIIGVKQYGLTGAIQIRAAGSTVTRTDEGDASPLETSVIDHMAGMERITQFSSRLAITYRNVSLLVRNMPLEDADRCGRLRDHLAMLIEGIDAHAEAIVARTEARRREIAIDHAVTNLVVTLGEVDQMQRHQQVTSRLAVESLVQEMQVAYASVAMTTAQEDFMDAVLQSGLNHVVGAQSDMQGLQDRLSSIVTQLTALSTA